jgi:dolichol-phosphate mannosyltransferase
LVKVNKKIIDFTILIPTYNDGENIRKLFYSLKKHLSDFNYYVCFVNDSEGKSTTTNIKKIFKKNFYIIERKKKERYSVRFSASLQGFQWINKNIKSDYVIEIDTDLSHHPRDIPRGLKILKEKYFDILIGSKYHNKSLIKNRSFLRGLISKIITCLCQFLFDNSISDYTNTFRIYNMKTVKVICKRKIHFKSPVGHLDNLLFLLKKGVKISDFPTSYIEINPNKSSISLGSYWFYFRELFYCILKNKFNFL